MPRRTAERAWSGPTYSFAKCVTPDGKPAESRLDFLRRELRENTTLAVGECDELAGAMAVWEADSVDGSYSFPARALTILLRIRGNGDRTLGRWAYRDRNGAERRIAIPERGE